MDTTAVRNTFKEKFGAEGILYFSPVQFVERTGRLLAVAADNGYRRAVAQQAYRALHLPEGDSESLCYDLFGHCRCVSIGKIGNCRDFGSRNRRRIRFFARSSPGMTLPFPPAGSDFSAVQSERQPWPAAFRSLLWRTVSARIRPLFSRSLC